VTSDPADPALDEAAASEGSPSAGPPSQQQELRSTSPEASFVAQLMTCARERRRIRRASPADADSAYRSRQAPETEAGRRMRQVV